MFPSECRRTSLDGGQHPNKKKKKNSRAHYLHTSAFLVLSSKGYNHPSLEFSRSHPSPQGATSFFLFKYYKKKKQLFIAWFVIVLATSDLHCIIINLFILYGSYRALNQGKTFFKEKLFNHWGPCKLQNWLNYCGEIYSYGSWFVTAHFSFLFFFKAIELIKPKKFCTAKYKMCKGKPFFSASLLHVLNKKGRINL